ncbi:DNA-binding MarR family transcriptional regulator [Microbacterium resistens]|uniref:DNA-binding MarR family transcriptional regulator n=1 Tax=Microbacterium resistens TaxID=156977 RepID=A0ABU1SCG3_9MICO|nr:MarR family transcriptional regulator [Microbacterium resistens]MDR6866603.1 DNA-binding MarR family transcriptional regulator [Microbacterium resistens]
MSDRKLAIEAWESLFRAQHEIFIEMSADFDGAGLSAAEYDVLLTVTRCGDRTVRLRELTANMLISQPSVSRLVDRMVGRGLLTKGVDPTDGRGAVIHATDDGVRKFRQLATVHGRTIAEKMAPLTEEEQRTLRALTRKLRSR